MAELRILGSVIHLRLAMSVVLGLLFRITQNLEKEDALQFIDYDHWDVVWEPLPCSISVCLFIYKSWTTACMYIHIHIYIYQQYVYIYIYARPPPKIYLFDVWREFIYEINPLLSYLKWIRTWTPIQMAHTNNTHKPHTISYPNQTFCPI